MDISTDQQTYGASGKAINTESTPQYAHLCCLDVTSYFPELAELFHRNDCLLKDVNGAITKQETAIQSFSETVKKFHDVANRSVRKPRSVRPWRLGFNPANLTILPLTHF